MKNLLLGKQFDKMEYVSLFLNTLLNKRLLSQIKIYKIRLKQHQEKIEGTFRGYSLHCGGIVYYPNGIPEDKLLPSSEKTVMKQVILNKVNVAEDKNFKIDILSSRGLTQLYQIVNYQSIDFDKHQEIQKQ